MDRQTWRSRAVTEESSSGESGPQPGSDRARGPLHGVRVLDLGTVYAAPITAMLLGDYGAEVVKVEHPRGDPARTHGHDKNGHGLWWKVISRNKRTVTLNVGNQQGQDILRRLVEHADVLIENFRPGVMERWHLGPEELLRVNPVWSCCASLASASWDRTPSGERPGRWPRP